jgi:hypothetical protein
VQDAIETLSAETGKKCESDFQRMGARLTTTAEVLQELSTAVVASS